MPCALITQLQEMEQSSTVLFLPKSKVNIESFILKAFANASKLGDYLALKYLLAKKNAKPRLIRHDPELMECTRQKAILVENNLQLG
ncbi:uncharacterized protein LOC114264260 isoform X8 [Camellia sinensis]|uniref:uncharacterized protein LOC114264260 isoform X8 n=1 Tax=Camellia sinensis TaxID=4442 RepID=UPI001035BFA9|nr:uncharacterized protein LOC114264260 isoform X8 [Camellia sinensis]